MTHVQIITTVSGPAVAIRGDDIDTDRIIPARFMKEVTFVNMGDYAFHDVRRTDAGELNDHPFNRREGARLLVVNANFGCGSSREHAPQALMRWGVRALVGESFAEIFAGNCTALGIPTATADAETVGRLQDEVERRPETVMALDVEQEVIRLGAEAIPVRLAPAQRAALLRGQWDTTALMHEAMDAVHETYRRLPYTRGFRDGDRANSKWGD